MEFQKYGLLGVATIMWEFWIVRLWDAADTCSPPISSPTSTAGRVINALKWFRHSYLAITAVIFKSTSAEPIRVLAPR